MNPKQAAAQMLGWLEGTTPVAVAQEDVKRWSDESLTVVTAGLVDAHRDLAVWSEAERRDIERMLAVMAEEGVRRAT